METCSINYILFLMRLYELYFWDDYMDYPDCRCPPDYETVISRTLSMENEEKEVKNLTKSRKQLKNVTPTFQVKSQLSSLISLKTHTEINQSIYDW